MSPVRVGFRQTSLTVRCELAITAPATKKKAAEEGSPGTRTSWPTKRAPGVTVIEFAARSTVKFAPKAFKSRSV